MTQPDNAQNREGTFRSVIDAAIDDYAKRYALAIETACEAALQSGDYGVLVIDWTDCCEARLSADVPYGCIENRIEPRPKPVTP